MLCRKVFCVAVTSVLSFFSLANAQSATDTHTHARDTKLVFEPAANKSDASFITRHDGLEAYFTQTGAILSIPSHGKSGVQMEFRLLGTEHQVNLRAEEKLSSYSNYLIGPDARNWRTHVDNYARLRYQSIYPGIDLVYYGNGRDLEHDFIVSPGAEAGKIGFKINHAVKVTITGDGDLKVDFGGPLVLFRKPVAYQEIAGKREPVQAEFVRRSGTDTIGFFLGAYDHSRQLVIDPVLSFATYLDGTQNDAITATTTDAAGNVYVTGQTTSADFPLKNPPANFCPNCASAATIAHAFISKLDPTGQTLLYSTFIGGSSGELGSKIAIDSNGNIIVSGTSSSSDFPQAGSFVSQAPQINGSSYFLASITPDGTAFNYAGLLGQQGGIGASSGVMALDSAGNAYLAGDTESASFPITPGTLATSVPGFPTESMFISKIASTGALAYSTIVPGTLTPDPTQPNVDQFTAWGIAIDSGGNAIVAGNAGPGLPTTAGVVGANFPLPTNIGATAGFALKLNPTASALVFSSYVPGADNIRALAVDGLGNMFVTGQTNETNLAVSANAFQKTVQPSQNCTCSFGYVLELDSQAQSILNASYLTGTTASSNIGTIYTGIALDSHSNILVSGSTASSDVPMRNPLHSQFTTVFAGTPTEGYTAELSADFSTLLFGSFLSGTDAANFTAVSIGPADNAILAGTTFGNDFPTTPAAFQTVPPPPASQFVSFPHTWVAKIDLGAQAPSACFNTPSLAFGAVLVGTSATQTLDVTNCGNAPLQITSITSSLATVTTSQSCGTVAPGAVCPVQVAYSPVSAVDQIGTLTFADNASIASQVLGVSGTGGVPQVFFPASFAVSELIVGTQQEFFLQFENTGNGNWIVNSVTATGDFTVDNQCTTPLPPVDPVNFGACLIGIIFAPTQPGLRSGTLTITDNVAGSPHVISLSGNALSTYPTPSIVSVTPVATDNRLSPEMVVTGTNFLPASQVFVNGSPRVAHYEGEGFLSVDLQASDVATIGEVQVTVANPAPGGGASNSFTETIYGAIRNIQILHSVFEPHSGLIYASVSATSTAFAGELIAVDPSTAQVVNHFSIGTGPNHLAISDDGTLLYAGLDGDGTVAQIALPAGTVNFAHVLGTDPSFGKPLVADALRVLPGLPHSWAVTICATFFTPCGLGVAVFDDATERTTAVSENQLDADGLLFIGNDATTLYATSFTFLPSTFWKFSINSSGITETSATTNFSTQSPGGAELDSDGTLIYAGNGEVIDPGTVTIKSNLQGVPSLASLRLDVPASRIYFAGVGQNGLQVASFDLASQQRLGVLNLPEFGSFTSEIYRWGTNGLAVADPIGVFILRSSLTGPVPPAQFSVAGLSPASAVVGSSDLALTIHGTGFAAGDTVSANGVALTASIAATGNQITTTVPAALLTSAGNLQVTVTAPNSHVGNLVLILTPTANPVAALSASSLSFAAQLVTTASAAQSITLTNNGGSDLVFNSIAASGDFSQTNNCANVAPGLSCSISVTFTPTLGGSRSGTLTINDNGASSPQVVNLNGTGNAFAISASSSSVTVSAGQTAAYTLNVNAPGGLSGQITFSCSSLPANASCSFNPASASLGGNSATVTVSIATAQQTASLFHSTRAVFALLVFPIGLISLGNVRRRRRSRAAAIFFGTALLGLLFLVAGCGGGSGTSGGGPHTVFTPAGTYTVVVTASGGGTSQNVPLTLTVQ